MRVKRSLDDALKRKEELHKVLNSYEHFGATPTLDYGPYDPHQVELCSCIRCGSIPQYKEVMRTFIYWQVVCKCGARSGTFVFQWRAALDWCTHNLKSLDYKQLPLFDLANLNYGQARERMIGIRDNLMVRVELIDIYKICAQFGKASPPGRQYERRLRAYLEWARLAIKLIKFQEYEARSNARMDHTDNV